MTTSGERFSAFVLSLLEAGTLTGVEAICVIRGGLPLQATSSSLRGAQGAQGAQGVQGPQGAQGPAGAGSQWVTKNSNYNLVKGDQILADTSGAPLTFTLPASPASGDYVMLLDPAGSWAGNNLTVARNGSNVAGVAADLVCDLNNQELLLTYSVQSVFWTSPYNTTSYTFSNGALTVTRIAGASPFNIIANSGIPGGAKRYFESIVTNPVITADEWAVGIASSQFNVAGNGFGFTANSIGIYETTGVYINSVNVLAASLVTGDNVGIAVDTTNNRIWFRINGGNWNNSPSANPATNVGGIDISTLNAFPLFPVAFLLRVNEAISSKFIAASWVYAAPGGFTEVVSTASGWKVVKQ